MCETKYSNRIKSHLERKAYWLNLPKAMSFLTFLSSRLITFYTKTKKVIIFRLKDDKENHFFFAITCTHNPFKMTPGRCIKKVNKVNSDFKLTLNHTKTSTENRCELLYFDIRS